MTRTPSGKLIRTSEGCDLVLQRTLRAGIDDVWASVTEPQRTARWFGRWEGEGAPGNTIKLQMAFEEQEPWCDLRIDVCEPPRRLVVSMLDDAGAWQMELRLSEEDGSTTLQLIHHLDTDVAVGEAGPGWEYYLDMLVAARDNAPLPSFDGYYPAQKVYYDALKAS